MLRVRVPFTAGPPSFLHYGMQLWESETDISCSAVAGI